MLKQGDPVENIAPTARLFRQENNTIIMRIPQLSPVSNASNTFRAFLMI